MPGDQLASVLRRIAGSVSSSLDLKEVFGRVAEATAEALPFDVMIVMRHEREGVFEVHSTAGSVQGPPQETPLAKFSPAVREFLTTGGRIDDIQPLVDPAFPMDRPVRDDGMRSAIAVPVRRGGRLDAVVAIGSSRVAAYSLEHETALRSIADVLGLALEHERLWRRDLARQRRLDAVDALLPTLAQALDVRAIFNQVSTVVQTVLAHDRLMLVSLSADRRTITVDALSGEPVPSLTRTESMPTECSESERLDPEVVADLESEPEEDRCQKGRQLGVRSLLRVPMRLPNGRVGALVFLAKSAELLQRGGRRRRPPRDRLRQPRALVPASRRAGARRRRGARPREPARGARRRAPCRAGDDARIPSRRRRVEVVDRRAAARGEGRADRDDRPRDGRVGNGQGSRRAPPAQRLGAGARAVRRAGIARRSRRRCWSRSLGHEKGAFTGATASRAGSIEQAAGGVLFLDEVGEMTRPVQAKLLRVLQEREFQRLGATKPMRADVRVVAATNRDLAAAIARGEFREDLYYRLQVFEIRLPPLRERTDDVLALAEAFLEEHGQAVGRPAAGISKDAREALLAYRWPGNVRELRNVLERATILCDGGLITTEHLPRELAKRAASAGHVVPKNGPDAPSGPLDLESVERAAIVRALSVAGNNRSQAARLLGIARPQLYSRLKKFGIGDEAAVAKV